MVRAKLTMMIFYHIGSRLNSQWSYHISWFLSWIDRHSALGAFPTSIWRIIDWRYWKRINCSNLLSKASFLEERAEMCVYLHIHFLLSMLPFLCFKLSEIEYYKIIYWSLGSHGALRDCCLQILLRTEEYQIQIKYWHLLVYS